MADQISMPSGMGGLTRYFDEFQSKIQLKPSHVIIIIVLFIAFEVGIKMM
ncbi:MAG: preprotein translocase subunit Sec61beta [Nanoarchaeota archaeon]|nr:preprotein translocase subunit Sec61beta [Nanoarchaeota archaeon]